MYIGLIVSVVTMGVLNACTIVPTGGGYPPPPPPPPNPLTIGEANFRCKGPTQPVKGMTIYERETLSVVTPSAPSGADREYSYTLCTPSGESPHNIQPYGRKAPQNLVP